MSCNNVKKLKLTLTRAREGEMPPLLEIIVVYSYLCCLALVDPPNATPTHLVRILDKAAIRKIYGNQPKCWRFVFMLCRATRLLASHLKHHLRKLSYREKSTYLRKKNNRPAEGKRNSSEGVESRTSAPKNPVSQQINDQVSSRALVCVLGVHLE